MKLQMLFYNQMDPTLDLNLNLNAVFWNEPI